MWLMQKFLSCDVSMIWSILLYYEYIIISEKYYFGINCPQTSVFFFSESLHNFGNKHILSFTAKTDTQRLPSTAKWESNSSTLLLFASCLLQLSSCSKGIAISGSTQLFNQMQLPMLILHTCERRHRLFVWLSLRQQSLFPCSARHSRL